MVSVRIELVPSAYKAQSKTTLPIIIKGVQSVEDIQLCVDHGVQGVILVTDYLSGFSRLIADMSYVAV